MKENMDKLSNSIRIELIGADRVIDDLDISVEIKKTNEPSPNYCTVTIYNLSDDTNNLIKERCTGARVYIAQGNEEAYQMVFEGDLRDLKKYKKPSKSKAKKPRKKKKSTATPKYNAPAITTEFDDADIKTVIELQDGRKASFQDNFFVKSYAGRVTNKQVISDILNTFRANNVPVGKIDSLPEIEYKNGKVYHGPAVSLLNSLVARAGGSFYIQNGIISITNPGSSPEVYAIVLDGTNCARPEEESNKEIKIEAPLLPTLNPNDYVKLDFKNVAGVYRVFAIETKFDNFGEANGSEIVVKSS